MRTKAPRTEKIHTGRASTAGMRRRQVVAALGLLVTATAGCANTPRPEPRPPETPGASEERTTAAPGMRIQAFEPTEGPDGDLLVEMTVHNPAASSRETRLLVTARAGDTTRSATRELTMGPGQTRDLSVTVPLSYADWDRLDSGIDFAFDER